ncbi:MAG TPA: LytR C-terminal domain-containing protein [Solirubrobacterales bacterium]|nr:LytR C-terminal domain-containing protein [Solirubrobacterales bacterium]
MDIIVRIGYYVGTAAFLGLAFLIPLYVSQRRDVHRLRLWSEYAPAAPAEAEHAATTSVRLAHEGALTEAAAQAATERADRRAERAARGAPPQTAAARVAAERPAAARTGEQMAVYREPRWRTWLRRGPTTRELLYVMAGAFLLGVVIVGGSQVLLSNEATPDVSDTSGGTGIVKGDVEVGVLNGTAVPGLAAAVGDDVEANGYTLGRVTNSPTPAEQTVVLYERGHEEEAKFVAKDLGVDVVQLIDDESRELADGADVVVVAGEDRAQA